MNSEAKDISLFLEYNSDALEEIQQSRPEIYSAIESVIAQLKDKFGDSDAPKTKIPQQSSQPKPAPQSGQQNWLTADQIRALEASPKSVGLYKALEGTRLRNNISNRIIEIKKFTRNNPRRKSYEIDVYDESGQTKIGETKFLLSPYTIKKWLSGELFWGYTPIER